MKKFIKSKIFLVIITAIVFTGVGVIATVTATSIAYEPSWTKTNGDPITNVAEAIDTLYTKSLQKIVLNTFGSASYDEYIGTQTTTEYRATVDVTGGKYLVLRVYLGSSGTITQVNQLASSDLFCTSGNCNITQLSGKKIAKSATRGVNSIINIYYVEINETTDKIYAKNANGSTNSADTAILSLHVIPIN